MFAVVFALSLNLVEVLLFEILDVLDPRYAGKIPRGQQQR
jgi:hypothetical protein